MKRFFNLPMIKNLKLKHMIVASSLITAFACSAINSLLPSLNLSKITYDVNETIVVNYSNLSANATNWIGIYVAGTSHDAYLQCIYSNGAVNGTMRFDGLATPGEYEARLFFNNSYILEYEVSFTVGAGNQSPTVSFIQPSAGTVSSNLGVVVEASDPDGSISKVSLYINNSLVRDEGEAPYEWGTANDNFDDPLLLNCAPGTYQLLAVAIDNDGDSTSATLFVTVEEEEIDEGEISPSDIVEEGEGSGLEDLPSGNDSALVYPGEDGKLGVYRGYYDNQGSHVSTRSLYLKQLQDRLGEEAVQNVKQLNETGSSWKFDWGGLSLIFLKEESALIQLLDSPVAHTIGIILRENSHKVTEHAVRRSALHKRILDHNRNFPSNKIAFVFIPGPEIAKKEIDTINYMHLPLVESKIHKKTAAIRVDVNIEATYAVLLTTGDEITLKFSPLKEERTCELLSDYPNSTLTPLAQQRLKYIAKYADYNFEPLRQFEHIRKVEFLRIKNNSADKKKVLDKAKRITEHYKDAAIIPVIYYWLANQYRSGDAHKAEETYLTLLNKYPDHPYAKDVWWEIGETYYDSRNYTEAIKAFNHALRTSPASSDEIKAQINRAQRNLRRKNLNVICLLVPVLMILFNIFLPPLGIRLHEMLKTLLAFLILLIIFSCASWLIAEQFSSVTELIKITTGVAAAFTFGYPFSYVLSDKILRGSDNHSGNKIIITTLFGMIINLIFAVGLVYVTIYYANEHLLIIFRL
ncbi:MAG: Ig-like domain-containing protein [bacterium]